MSSHPQTDSVVGLEAPPVGSPSDTAVPSLAESSADLSNILERFRTHGEIDFNGLVIAAQRAGVAAGVLTLPVVEVDAAPAPAPVAPTPAPEPAPAAVATAPQPVTPSPLMGFEAHTPEQMRTLRDAGLLPPGIWERYVQMMRAQRNGQAQTPERAPAATNGHGSPTATPNGAPPVRLTPEERAMQLIQRLNKVGVALAETALPLLDADVALGITLAPDGWIVGSAILESTEGADGEATRLQHPILGYDNVDFTQLGDVVGRVLRETVNTLRRESSRG